MPSKEKKGGDFILESRHLVGLFMLLVVIFGVVFTLGYLLGRSQYDSRLRAAVTKTADADSPAAPPEPVAKSKPKTDSDVAPPEQASSDWDFYHAAEPKAADEHLQAPMKNAVVKQPVEESKPAAPPAAAAKKTKSLPPLNAPLIPKGAIMLQVAAVSTEGDALALAQALQQKKFPAFVITPSAATGADKFYRIQVGPYPDTKSATAARQDLEAKGFKSIIKR